MSFWEFFKRVWKEERTPVVISVIVMGIIALIEAFKVLLVLPLLQFMIKDQVQGSPTYETGLFGKMMDFFYWMAATLHVNLSLEFMLIFFVLVYILSALLLIFLNHFMIKLRLDYTYKLSRKVVRHCFASRWSFFVNQKPGKLVNILSVETVRAGNAFQSLCRVLSLMLVTIVYTAVVICVSWQLTLFIFVVVPVIFIFLRKITRLSQESGAKITQMNNHLQAEAMENILAAKMLKSSASEKRSVHYIGDIVKQGNAYYYLNYMCDALVSSLQEPIGTCILAATIYIGLAFLKMDPTVLMVTLIIFFRLTPRFYDMQRKYQVTLSYIPALQEVDRLLELTSEMEEKSGDQVFRQLNKGITFANVSYAYDQDKSVLTDVNLEVLKGESIGIVGESGSGKTTIADMTLGLIHPDQGEVLVDDVPLSNYDLGSWRNSLGYVTQEVHLFHDTVMENLRWMRPDAADEEIIAAAKMAHAHDFIEKMPEGYHSVIGDRGYRLSGGQRQRLALARVILSNPQIYIFDEATSSLDSESEKYIQQSIDSLSAIKTAIVISHRISTLRNVDKIYVVHDTRIVESGSWDELMEANGIFSKLARMQNL